MGYTENLCAYNTLQFNDYSRYEANMFDGGAKAKYKEEHFPEDLQKAYGLGKRLVEKAKANNQVQGLRKNSNKKTPLNNFLLGGVNFFIFIIKR